MVANKNAIILDLRTSRERKNKRLRFGGQVLYMSTSGSFFKNNFYKLNKSKQYLLVSKTGNSEEAQQLVKDYGFTNFIRVNGGIEAMYGHGFEE